MWQFVIPVLLFAVCHAAGKPAFLVMFPAVIPSGSQARLCAHILYPNETLRLRVFLDSESKTLLTKTTKKALFNCFVFQAPNVKQASVQTIKVRVQGAALLLEEQRKVMFEPVLPLTFIQTDKPVYKPGQTVNFRIVTMNTNLVPVNQLYEIVYLEDVNNNRLNQWTNITSTNMLLQLSYPLTTESPVGAYRIVLPVGMRNTEQTFAVKEYVLPRFDVKVNVPSEVNAVEPEVKLEACAKYTYGQPVPGKAELELCRNPYPWMKRINYHTRCLTESVQLNKSGCCSYAFNVTYFLGEGLEDILNFNAKIEEQGTGITLSESANMNINYSAGSVWFVDTPDSYQPGSIIKGKIKFVDYKSSPVAAQKIYLYEGFWEPLKLLKNLTTDQYGIANFSVNFTGQSSSKIQLRASYYPPYEIFHNQPQAAIYQDGMHTLSPFQPQTAPFSYLTIQSKELPLPCSKVVQIGVWYMLVEEKSPSNRPKLFYVILSRGAIVSHGSMQMAQPNMTRGNLTISLKVTPNMAPVVQVLVYIVLPSRNVISASMAFPTEKCFQHKVALNFLPHTAVPGEKGKMNLQAKPGALCALTVVDRSVLLLDPGKRLNADKLFSLLPIQKSTSIPYMVQDPEVCLKVRVKRFIKPPVENDALSAFQASCIEEDFSKPHVGLKVATNLMVAAPSCLLFMGKNYRSSYNVPLDFVRYSARAPSPAEAEDLPMPTVRTYFPETWIWDLVQVGQFGSVQLPVTVPDTITTWEADAFCLASTGLSLAPPTELRVFKPFFLDIILPYSIIRGEQFKLTATVFNYLAECIMVKMTAAPSSAYKLIPCTDCQYSSCLCASETKTFQWSLVASALGAVNVSVSAEAVRSQQLCDKKSVTVPERGRIDSVSRVLLVKAEGVEKTDSYSWLLCPNGGKAEEQVDLQLPATVVKGSTRASVVVLGDIMGQAIRNLDNFLAMPYGCGEQNLAVLASDVYIMQYLQSIQQLDPVLEKATFYLQSGYQRQLNYRNSNGSFSTFPGEEGNNWLTAFVIKTFTKAQTFIYIDPKIIKEAQSWLLTTQKEDGCFRTSGKLYHSSMKGGVEGDVTLTAYIAAALMESNISNPALNLSLACLRSDISYLTSTYTSALLAYTFTLAGDEQKRTQLMAHLYSLASTEGDLLYWSQSASEAKGSITVETTSYVLLAVLSTSLLSSANLGHAAKIVHWLVKQQNAYGGFASTQDTVVALQALALYSTMVKNPEGSSTVTVQSASGQLQVFTVNLGNQLLYQERLLQDVKGHYSIVVQGTRCVSVQITVHYNIPTPTMESSLHIITNVSSDCRGALTLNIKVQYNGSQEMTNMVLLDIKLLSGFGLDPSSLKQLKGSAMVEQVVEQDDHILVYLRELQRNLPLFYMLNLVQQLKLSGLKPAVIKMYDYYQPAYEALAEYTSPCK
ncbi:alpha-2-macroglobulin-like protein 1 [Scleropages formosus]|uniref:alpha-2-macroglobulin-like protein 1 n=1 Tax=Scleropages formosus TaxID=113540 RepID=UPI0008788CAB|nr:alpha-2-macroglobulin-like protein 1 [Scleropages formosus]